MLSFLPSVTVTELLLCLLLFALTYITANRKQLSPNHSTRKRRRSAAPGFAGGGGSSGSGKASLVGVWGVGRRLSGDSVDTDDETELFAATRTIASEIYSESLTFAQQSVSRASERAFGGEVGEGGEGDGGKRLKRPRGYSTEGSLLGSLLQDNLIHIFTFLSARDMVTGVAVLSRGLALFSATQNVWRAMFRAHFGEVIGWEGSRDAYERGNERRRERGGGKGWGNGEDGRQRPLGRHEPSEDLSYKVRRFCWRGKGGEGGRKRKKKKGRMTAGISLDALLSLSRSLPLALSLYLSLSLTHSTHSLFIFVCFPPLLLREIGVLLSLFCDLARVARRGQVHRVAVPLGTSRSRVRRNELLRSAPWKPGDAASARRLRRHSLLRARRPLQDRERAVQRFARSGTGGRGKHQVEVERENEKERNSDAKVSETRAFSGGGQQKKRDQAQLRLLF